MDDDEDYKEYEVTYAWPEPRSVWVQADSPDEASAKALAQVEVISVNGKDGQYVVTLRVPAFATVYTEAASVEDAKEEGKTALFGDESGQVEDRQYVEYMDIEGRLRVLAVTEV